MKIIRFKYPKTTVRIESQAGTLESDNLLIRMVAANFAREGKNHVKTNTEDGEELVFEHEIDSIKHLMNER